MATSSISPLKRHRTDDLDDAHSPTQERTPHPDLWYEDGSVVLATNSKLFRVHKSVLSKTSGVFADLFSVPQPVDSTETYEGLPLVHLAGDHDEDVAHFLKCIYERS